MTIVFEINAFLFELFPSAKQFGKDLNSLKNELIDFYTFGPYRPRVEIENDLVRIEIDVKGIANQKTEFDKVVKLCEKGRYEYAKPMLLKLIKKNPTVSEYHRILGQIHFDEGDQEKAMNNLVVALRWDPRNSNALIMMGNIFAQFEKDITTATKYYDQALAVNPKDSIAINNIGANLLQLGKEEEAKRYFEIAYEINPKYPNTTYAFGLIANNQEEYLKGFEYGIESIRNSKTNEPIHIHSVELTFDCAKSYILNKNGKSIIEKHLLKLETESEKQIEIVEDNSIPTAAKFELAENYNRDKHIVRYKSSYPSYEHLVMHELTHLEFFIKARLLEGGGKNKLFTTTKEHKELFIRDNEKELQKLEQLGYTDNVISNFITSLFQGLSQQISNAPIDLFIEEFLFTEFPELKPFQFLSLMKLLDEGLNAVTKKEIVELTPQVTLNASKIMNIISAMHFRDLFGVDTIPNYKATSAQIRTSQKLYEQFLVMKQTRQPADEYNLIDRWAEELNLKKYYELVDESEYRKKTNFENVLKEIEDDPFDLNKPLPNDALKEPLNYDKEPAGKMAVTLYCLDALQYFIDKTPEQIKEIGFEIAMLGRHGLNPHDSNKKLHIATIPNREFTALQLLAFMFVAWQTIDPTADLNLKFKNEYEAAKQMFKKK